MTGDAFWLIAAHGTRAGYVRNLQAEPRVRVKADGTWRSGTAAVLPGYLAHSLGAATCQAWSR